MKGRRTVSEPVISEATAAGLQQTPCPRCQQELIVYGPGSDGIPGMFCPHCGRVYRVAS